MKLQKKVGLAGATAIVVGGVIGMGAYALIPLIVSKAGSSAWLAMSIALIASLISVLPLIQISSAIPVAGGGYMYGSRLISPLAGVFTSSWAILGGASSICLISVGLVDYFATYLPVHLSPHIAAAVLVASFYVFYLFGLKLLSDLQIIMSIQLLVALLIYCIPMLYASHFSIAIGLPDNPSFLLAVILCSNLCLGFQIIIELGEEIHEPKKNIPLSLLIGAGTILVIYLAIVFAYTGVVGLESIASKPKLVDTARPFLSNPLIWFLQLGMISAGLTSYNGGAIALPREIFSMSRDKTLPEFLSRTNKNGNPTNAVTFFFFLVIAELIFGQLLDSLGVVRKFFGKDVIEFYGFMTIMGIMLLTIFISVAAYKLPAKYPEQYANAYIKFSKPLLNFFIIVSIVFSTSLIAIICTQWIVPVLYAVFTLIVFVAYSFRKKYLKERNIEIGMHFENKEWN